MAELAAALHQEALNSNVDDLIRDADAPGRQFDIFSNASDDGVPAVQLAPRSRNATGTGAPAQPAMWGREALGGKAMAATAAKEARETKQKERGMRAAVTRWMREADLSQPPGEQPQQPPSRPPSACAPVGPAAAQAAALVAATAAAAAGTARSLGTQPSRAPERLPAGAAAAAAAAAVAGGEAGTRRAGAAGAAGEHDASLERLLELAARGDAGAAAGAAAAALARQATSGLDGAQQATGAGGDGGEAPLSWRYRQHRAGMRPAKARVSTEDGGAGGAGEAAWAVSSPLVGGEGRPGAQGGMPGPGEAGGQRTSATGVQPFGAPSARSTQQGLASASPRGLARGRSGGLAAGGGGGAGPGPGAGAGAGGAKGVWQLPGSNWWAAFQAGGDKDRDRAGTATGFTRSSLPMSTASGEPPGAGAGAGTAAAVAAAGFRDADPRFGGGGADSDSSPDDPGTPLPGGGMAGADPITATAFGFERTPAPERGLAPAVNFAPGTGPGMTLAELKKSGAGGGGGGGGGGRKKAAFRLDDGSDDGSGAGLAWGRAQSFDARSAYHRSQTALSTASVAQRRFSVADLEEMRVAREEEEEEAAAAAGGGARKKKRKHRHRRRTWRERLQIFHPLTVMDACLPILRPDTIGRRSWDLVVMSMVVWTAVTVPLSVSFGTPDTLLWNAADHFMTGLFGIDLLVNFRTAFYNHQGELMRDSAAIAANYMKMWFWIDLAGTIPWDALITATGAFASHQENSTTLAALGFLKAPRMLRLGRLLRFLDGFKNAKVFRIVQLFLAMILISHWLACIWYMMYAFGGRNNAEEWAFMKATVPEGGSQGLAYYIMCFYSSFLLMVGDNINAYNNYERTFYCIVELLGVFFYSAVVGQMATLVATLNVTINRHGQKSIMTQDALRYMGVTEKVKDNVQSFFDFLQERSHPGAEGMAFLRELPSSLLRELQMYMYFKSVEKVPMFANLERGFLRALALRVQLQSMQPAEPVFRVGDVGHCMYFIRKGCIAVTSAHHEMVTLLKEGEVFGEVALLSTGKRTANCTALGFVDLAVLGKAELAAVMADFPQSAALIRKRVEERLTELAVSRQLWLPGEFEEDDYFETQATGRYAQTHMAEAGEEEADGAAAGRDHASDASGERDHGDRDAEDDDGDEGGARGKSGSRPPRLQRVEEDEEEDGLGSGSEAPRKGAGAGQDMEEEEEEEEEVAAGGGLAARLLQGGKPRDVDKVSSIKRREGAAPAAPAALAASPAAVATTATAAASAMTPETARSVDGGRLQQAEQQQQPAPAAAMAEAEGLAAAPGRSLSPSRAGSRRYWRELGAASATDVLQLTPRGDGGDGGQGQGDGGLGDQRSTGNGEAGGGGARPAPPAALSAAQAAALLLGDAAAGRPGSPSSRPASRVYWRSIDIARPTDVLQLTPRGEEERRLQQEQQGAGGGRQAASLDLTGPSAAAIAAAAARAVEQQNARVQRLYTRGGGGGGASAKAGAGNASKGSSSNNNNRDGASAVFPEPGPQDAALVSRLSSSELSDIAPPPPPPPATAAAAGGGGASARSRSQASRAGPDIYSSSLYAPSVGVGGGGGRQGTGTGRVGPGPVAEAVLEEGSPQAGFGGAAAAGQAPLSPGRGNTTGGMVAGRPGGRGAAPTATANQRRSSAVSNGGADATADELVAAALAAGGVPYDGPPARGYGHPYGHPHRAFATPSPTLPADAAAAAAAGVESDAAAPARLPRSGAPTGSGMAGAHATSGGMSTTGGGMLPTAGSRNATATGHLRGGAGAGGVAGLGRHASRRASMLTSWYMEQLVQQEAADAAEEAREEQAAQQHQHSERPPGEASRGSSRRGGGGDVLSPMSRGGTATGHYGHAHASPQRGGGTGTGHGTGHLRDAEQADGDGGMVLSPARLIGGGGGGGIRVPRLALPDPNAPPAPASAAAVVAFAPDGADVHMRVVITRRPGSADTGAASLAGGMSPAAQGGAAAPPPFATLSHRRNSRRESMMRLEGGPSSLGGYSAAAAAGGGPGSHYGRRSSGLTANGLLPSGAAAATAATPWPPLHTYVPLCAGGAAVQRLPDGGYYVSEQQWDQIMAVLKSVHGCESALCDLEERVVAVEGGVQRLEAGANTQSILNPSVTGLTAGGGGAAGGADGGALTRPSTAAAAGALRAGHGAGTGGSGGNDAGSLSGGTALTELLSGGPGGVLRGSITGPRRANPSSSGPPPALGALGRTPSNRRTGGGAQGSLPGEQEQGPGRTAASRWRGVAVATSMASALSGTSRRGGAAGTGDSLDNTASGGLPPANALDSFAAHRRLSNGGGSGLPPTLTAMHRHPLGRASVDVARPAGGMGSMGGPHGAPPPARGTVSYNGSGATAGAMGMGFSTAAAAGSGGAGAGGGSGSSVANSPAAAAAAAAAAFLGKGDGAASGSLQQPRMGLRPGARRGGGGSVRTNQVVPLGGDGGSAAALAAAAAAAIAADDADTQSWVLPRTAAGSQSWMPYGSEALGNGE